MTLVSYFLYIFKILNTARRFGATEFVNPKSIPEGKTTQEYLVEKFDGGFDYTFECIGSPATMVGLLHFFLISHIFSVKHWSLLIRDGVFPASLELLVLDKRSPLVRSNLSLEEPGREPPSEVFNSSR